MCRKNNFDKYIDFREKYKTFFYEGHEFSVDKNNISVSFHFSLDKQFDFHPEMTVHFNDDIVSVSEAELNVLLFQIGMVELISYWKAACSPEVVIKPFMLSNDQIAWWKKLYFNGLGEFFYLNSISADQDDFMHIRCDADASFQKVKSFHRSNGVIVPVGGGKDSIVSLEFFRSINEDIVPMMVNSRMAMSNSVNIAGIKEEKTVHIKRFIDPLLLELNSKGFLNGHTPFSSLLAFQSILVSYVTGVSDIALSNESSANESTVPGTLINHQYSKSLEFENDFRAYVGKYISMEFNYFSLLRPLSELQIAFVFSKHPLHFDSFRSCNSGSKSNTWCGQCPKCLFTAIMLRAFLPHEQIIQIFGYDIFDNENLLSVFRQLVGIEEVKPFECVGTPKEINISLNKISNDFSDADEIPFLLSFYRKSHLYEKLTDNQFMEFLKVYDDNHNLTPQRYEQLRNFVKHFH